MSSQITNHTKQANVVELNPNRPAFVPGEMYQAQQAKVPVSHWDEMSPELKEQMKEAIQWNANHMGETSPTLKEGYLLLAAGREHSADPLEARRTMGLMHGVLKKIQKEYIELQREIRTKDADIKAKDARLENNRRRNLRYGNEVERLQNVEYELEFEVERREAVERELQELKASMAGSRI
ncbi:uncharacterized protein PAC_17109 [Phialocephala subalpina]|uniref:Uncharacterized protein n=1 Tax=Phialocephala subalpina TaxID=576137 RepID=A0A1L7XQA1_9HELO|nr:uncharacterized protein PAC_17109 [Phialocephala subalpina]